MLLAGHDQFGPAREAEGACRQHDGDSMSSSTEQQHCWQQEEFEGPCCSDSMIVTA
jgi:hypothetical protein